MSRPSARSKATGGHSKHNHSIIKPGAASWSRPANKNLAMENIKLTFVDEDEDTNAHCFIDGNGDDGFLIETFGWYKKSSGFTRRIAAAWNYCAGIPTEDIEKMPLPALFFRQAYDGLQKENSALQHENQCLRAAVAEMQRMLPVLDNLEKHNPGTWSDLTEGTGIATANAYRQTLETALAQIEKNK